MAALQSIRSHGKLIAICVGGALLAFVLGDFINSGSVLFGASQSKVAEINGNSIDQKDLDYRIKTRENFISSITGGSVDSETSEQIREYVWEQIIRENTYLKYAEEQGLKATSDELAYCIQVGLVTPTMGQVCSPDGVYNPARAAEISKTDEYANVWKYMEDELREARLYNKYVNMVMSGLYVTNAEVQQEFNHRTQLSDIKFVSVPLSEVSDEEVQGKITDAQLKASYDELKNIYYRSIETRNIDYVRFNMIPTSADSADAYKIALNAKEGLETEPADEVPSYVDAQSDIKYFDYHYSKGDLNNEIVDSLMFSETPGYVYGPYVEGEFYKTARLIEFSNRPDSVNVSHIIVAYRQPGAADSVATKAKADSLMDVLKSGVDFGALAAQASDDRNAVRDSGNIRFLTELTPMGFDPAFKNACFETETGKVTLVKANYGYHILKVNSRTALKKKATIGFVAVEIRPSKNTRDVAYGKASAFAANYRTNAEFQHGIEVDSLIRRNANDLTVSTRNIASIENSREIVRWAFDDDKNKEVYGAKEHGDSYIVASLTGVNKKGYPSMESLKPILTTHVLRKLKGEILAEKMKGASSVDALAAQLNKNVQEATTISFENYQIPGIGADPAVIATAALLTQGQVSAPVVGSNAVYVLQNTSFTPAQPIQELNIATDRKQMERVLRGKAQNSLYASLIKMANIEDMRWKIY
ncbi:MAG: SurA N-terminal domain-containing protein [Bacteroidales bacterium]|nr:SurA N-terminal domain-containing protein [Bacteroidales bacterium]